ncbi:hypothetical protein TDB9533_00394 [Thalassocella blandensis]|nr:hypothetical protein TDB9533_00394 [Thalassocella blandensis]
MQIRPESVAGRFYSEDPAALSYQLDELLRENFKYDDNPRQPKALIVPHAGYIYSGVTASTAYQKLLPFRDNIDTVILLGLSHRVPFTGIATSSAESFRTPLGTISLNRDILDPLIADRIICENDQAHRWEHSLEVQLPFLQKTLSQFTLVPFATGFCTAEEVAQCLDYVWGNEKTLIVISSDLSHFHPYQEAIEIDNATCQKILHKETALSGEQACGSRGINGFLHKIRHENFGIELIDYRNSGDTAGDKSRVVGYGAFAFYSE